MVYNPRKEPLILGSLSPRPGTVIETEEKRYLEHCRSIALILAYAPDYAERIEEYITRTGAASKEIE